MTTRREFMVGAAGLTFSIVLEGCQRTSYFSDFCRWK